MEKRMNGVEAKYMIEDVVRTPICTFKYTGLDNDGNKINPFSYIAKQENEDFNAAVARFRNAIDMNKVVYTKKVNMLNYELPYKRNSCCFNGKLSRKRKFGTGKEHPPLCIWGKLYTTGGLSYVIKLQTNWPEGQGNPQPKTNISSRTCGADR